MSRRASSLDKTLVGIERDVGSEYDNVKIVAENIEAVKAASGHADTATAQAAIATAQAAIATNAASSTATSESNASTSESSAEEWANKPEDSLVSAIAGGDLVDDYSALHHANKASASATAAATSETNVINLEASAQSILDTLNGTYLGVQAANPTLDLNGDPIDAGDWYFNSVDDVTRIYDGAIWHDTAISREEFYDKIQADARFVNLAGSTMTGELKTPSIQLLGGTGTQGTFSWNSNENTVDLVQNGSILQLGQEIHYHVENQTGVTIPNGTAVMFAGSISASGRGTVEPMVADGSITPQYFLGVTTEDLLNGGSGKVTHFGRVRGIDTSMYSEGDALWLDPIVPGGFTTTKPQSPNLKLLVAVVINSHAINGTILCRAGAGTDLHDDHRTEVLNPDAAGNPQVANSTWIWNDTLTRWENKTPAETKTALGYYTSSDRGVADGIASLDSGGKVPSAQLPSYVDDVLEYANLAAFPGSGETGKIYIAIDTGSTYRWTGTIYVEISQALDAADVKSLYESNANTNEFNDAEKTKLGTVETGATADQTDAEIKTAYENNADTNVFTDAEKTKLGTVESNAKDDQSAAEVPYTNTTSLLTATNVQAAVDEVEGRLDTAETKLAGIESGATADQTAGEIKTAYESNADTNVFTDSEKTKLSGIETGATADQTGAEIKAAYEGEADTNAFTDAEKTKLDSIDLGSAPNSASASRNQVVNQDPLSQGEAQRNGIGILSYLGNGTSQTIPTGVDMFSADFGGLIWIKDRDAANSHFLQDSVRSNFDAFLSSNTTAAEALAGGTGIASVTASGFNVGSSTGYNTSGRNYAAWCFQTTKIATGLTNRNKAYTCHYNPDMGFSIVGYGGDGTDGHEIPHHLGRTPDLSIWKNRNSTASWIITSPLLGHTGWLQFDADALATNLASPVIPNEDTIKVYFGGDMNANGNNHISYHFANTPGVLKVGKYIGTGVAGNYVECGFKPAFILVKNLTSAANSWFLLDSARGNNVLLPDLANTEVAYDYDSTPDGVVWKDSNSGVNALNDEYLFLAFAESAFAGGIANTSYSYATAANEVTINQDTLISFAEGFNTNGEVNTQEQVGASTTFTVPGGNANKKLYLYKDKAGAYGVTEYRPLEEQDYFGVQSPLGNDVNLRTTARHFDYESSTGVASASEETGSQVAWGAFSARPNDILPSTYWAASTPTTSWLQYKFSEPRVLKSWRLREVNDTTESPRRFTIEGSNDGLNWTAIDSTYTSADYSGNGTNLWGDLQDTSANTTVYLYYRIYITANNGDVTYTSINQLELNTITPSDRYDVVDGKMYDSAVSPISRVYLGEFRTDGDGDIIAETLVNYTPAKRKVIDEEVHGDLVVRGDIKNDLVATALVTFDGSQNPPLILNSVGIADVVDLGTGNYAFVSEDDLNFDVMTFSSFAGDSDYIINRSGNSTNKRLEVFVRDVSAGTLADAPFVSMIFYGGKD